MAARAPSLARFALPGGAVAMAASLGAYAVLHRLGTTSGSTVQERSLHSRTHLPPGWDVLLGASLVWVWTFALDPAPGGRTRMLVRNRGRVHPAWLDLAYRMAIVPADHVVTRGLFRGLQTRVQA